MIHLIAKVSERTNRNLPARNTLVQLLALYTNPQNPESHNAQRHRQTDRRTDDKIMPIADHICVAVRSAKTVLTDTLIH